MCGSFDTSFRGSKNKEFQPTKHNQNFTFVFHPRDNSSKLRHTTPWLWSSGTVSGRIAGAKRCKRLQSVFRYNFYTTVTTWSEFSPLVFSHHDKMLEFIRNLRRSTSQQLQPRNEQFKVHVTPPQVRMLVY